MISILLISLLETLIPFQLLSWQDFKKYYEEMIDPGMTIGKSVDTGGVGTYQYSNWKVHAIQLQSLLMIIFGKNRHTRYLHGIVSCGEVWFDIAYALKDTPRNLFGNDGIETTNDVVKSTLRRNTIRFGMVNGSIRTIRSIMNWYFWQRYEFRENSRVRNTYARTHAIHIAQRKRDQNILRQPNNLRVMFGLYDVDASADFCKFNSDFARRNLKNYDKMFTHDWRDINNVNVTGMVDDHFGLDFPTLGENDADGNIPNNSTNDNVNNDILNDNDDNDDNSGDEMCFSRDITQEYNTIQSCYIGVSSQQDSQTDRFGRWMNLEIVSQQNSRLFFGMFHLKIQGHFVNIENRNVTDHIRVEWPYRQIRAIHVELFQNNEIYIFLKATECPKIEIQTTTGWERATEPVTKFDKYLHDHGKIKICIIDDDSRTIWNDISSMVDDHPSIYSAHIRTNHDFWFDSSNNFDQDERDEANSMFEKMISPLMGSHDALYSDVQAHFQMMESGAKRICVNCLREVGWYQKHASCFQEKDIGENVSYNIFSRMTPNPRQLNIRRVQHDPYQPINVFGDLKYLREEDVRRSKYATIIIKRLPDFWSRFILVVHQQCIQWVIEKKKDVFGIRESIYSLRKDNDWWQCLRIHAGVLFKIIDRSFEQILKSKAQQPEIENMDEFIHQTLAAVSGIFRLDNIYRQNLDAVNITEEERQRLHVKDAYFAWNIYVVDHPDREPSTDWDMVQWGRRYWRKIRKPEKWRSYRQWKNLPYCSR